MNKIQQLKRIAARNKDGFTVFTDTLEHVTSGWVVAMKETQNCFGDEGLKKALDVAEKTSRTIGGWLEGKRWYWDAVLIFDNEEEATKAGKENEQIAIFHIETATVKYM